MWCINTYQYYNRVQLLHTQHMSWQIIRLKKKSYKNLSCSIPPADCSTPSTFITWVTVTLERIKGESSLWVEASLVWCSRQAVSMDAGTDHDMDGESQLSAVGAYRIKHPGIVADPPLITLSQLQRHGLDPDYRQSSCDAQPRQARVLQAAISDVKSGINVTRGLVNVEERVIKIHIAKDKEAKINEGSGVAFNQHRDVDAVT